MYTCCSQGVTCTDCNTTAVVSSGDAEAYGLVSILSSITGVACIYLLSEVLSLLARLNMFMQRKTSDFSKLPIMLSSIVHQLMSLKEPGTCIDADKAIYFRYRKGAWNCCEDYNWSNLK